MYVRKPIKTVRVWYNFI